MTDRPTNNRQGGGDSTRNPRFPNIDETDIQRALATRFGDGSPSETDSTADSPESDTQEDLGEINSDEPPSPEELSEVGGSSTPETESDGDGPRPYIKITPAREQVTPDHVIKGLYGLYRAGSGRTLPFHVERRLSFVSTHHSFEFLIHKPEATQRFDFYLGVRPYEVEAVETVDHAGVRRERPARGNAGFEPEQVVRPVRVASLEVAEGGRRAPERPGDDHQVVRLGTGAVDRVVGPLHDPPLPEIFAKCGMPPHRLAVAEVDEQFDR